MEKTLAHYQILEPLGAGGMGKVFRARDTRLGRDVALKLLPPETAADETARARMLREARTASSLNHPHVCTVYEVGEADGQIYIAMELVGGRPLSEQIPAGGLPTGTVLRYGAQVADALAHAHAQGVVHRDLKTSNVMISADGRAKVLDFGLSRKMIGDRGDATRSTTLTESGAIAGTPQYLAPELLKGEKADARSDLWALGVMLQEMAAGEMPFGGRTDFELSAAILNQPAMPLPERVPPGLRALIRRCLEKEPSQRYQSAVEARAALEALQSDAAVSVIARPSHTGRSVAIAASVVAAAALAWVAYRMFFQPPRPHGEIRQQQLTSSPGGISGGSLSPDGKYLVYGCYGDDTGISLRLMETGDTHPIVLPPGVNGLSPIERGDWFPDGTRILLSGLSKDGKNTIWELPVAGGVARKLMDDGRSAMISRDGTRIAFARDRTNGADIWWMGANGQGARRVVASDSTGELPGFAAWSPSGDRLAYARFVHGPDGPRQILESCDLEGHTCVFLSDSLSPRLHGLTQMQWAPDGRVIFPLFDPPPNQSDMNLWSLQVDPHSGKPSGRPQQITHWFRTSYLVPSGITTDGRRLTVNLLQYQSDVQIGEIARGDSLLHAVRRLTLDDRFDLYPSWMPDNRTILFTSDRNGTFDIFKQSLDQTSAEVVIAGSGDQISPRVSPDGRWLLYWDHAASKLGAPTEQMALMRVPAGGGAPETVLVASGQSGFRCANAPATLSVLREDESDGTVFAALDPIRGRGRQVARLKGAARGWDLSPDGSQIAVVDANDSIPALRVITLADGGERRVRLSQRISLAYVTWSAGGDAWYVVGVTDSGWMMMRVDHLGRCTHMIPRAYWMYSLAASPDGRRVAFTSNTGMANLWLLENF